MVIQPGALARQNGAEWPTGHRILKKGDSSYGTVSSALIAVPGEDLRRLIWRYAPGPPDETEYRSYGNLGKRLMG